MRAAMDSGSRLGDLLPPAEPEPPGDRFPDAVWKAMSKEEKDKENARREKIHTENAHNESHRYAWMFRADMAKQVLDEPMIWFPHGADFRGRLYAEVNDLSPQGSDEGKALLEFAHGKALGEDGLAWLYIRAASCYATEKTPTGDVAVDKLPFRGREEWTLAHLDQIHSAADYPLDDLWWTEAEDPWCFLATCFEISLAVRSGDPRTFISHLPIPLDGSCNGLQHLSALGRDREGALATNVISDDGDRRDIYSEVAEILKRLVAADAGKGNKLALEWQPKIKRSLVKKAVMTTPYGISDGGIAHQLLKSKDKPTEGFEEETPAANYLKDQLVKAIDETVSAATKIKEWLAAVAGALATHDIPFRWQTPSGNTLQQAYWVTATHKVKTLAGDIILQLEQPADPALRRQEREEEELRKQALWQQHLARGGDPRDKKKVMRKIAKEIREGRDKAGLRQTKQKRAASPNLIHSFDSAHLCRTVNACSDEWLLKDFAMIHDSFGVHAADTTLLSDVLRKEFVRIYEGTNWLAEIEAYVRGYAPEVKIPSWSAYVTLGDLQLYPGVLKSQHFFS
jgi:DNA-directed RNA polymerase